MTIPVVHNRQKRIAQALLIGLPTWVVMSYVIHVSNQWLSVFDTSWVVQSTAFGLGMVAALFVFAYGVRMLTLTIGLLLLAAFFRWGVQWLLPLEFDAFFVLVRFNNLFFLFLIGWLAGYGFSRSRFFSILWCVLLLSAMGWLLATTTTPAVKAIQWAMAPVLLYVAYLLYSTEMVRRMNADSRGFAGYVARRLAGFAVLMALVLWATFSNLSAAFTAVEKEWENGGQPKEQSEKQQSMTRNDGTGISPGQSMGLQGFNNRANKDSLVFVARLDNFFPDGATPNPLYFVSDYYSLFDTLTQTFETDTLRPYNDLYSPDLTTLPLYFKAEDTAVLRQSMATQNLREASVEVYKKSLSARHFTAPTTAYFVQPISVPEENRDLYRSAYRAKMRVSELNSAYFVYNPAGDPALEMFQEQRIEKLRKVTGYEDAPWDFMDYYTRMPRGIEYDSIALLAKAITQAAGAATPIDQMVAIRDHFLATDSTGQPTFRYSDNPGIPGIPSANKLCYFLFENKKGYCAYYAGATLFLLRSLGIPSRIATGFLTVDRSNKNPGWYWFYEDQAHAWVQAWFPGYGWLDFDTTVPSTETQEAPQPDQTPPLTTQTAWMVLTGTVVDTDTLRKSITMQASQLLYHDKPYKIDPARKLQLDISMARVLRDTGQVDPASLVPGLDIVAVSFAEVFKNLRATPNQKVADIMAAWPEVLPIDEIKIIDPQAQAKEEDNKQKLTAIPWRSLLLWGSIALAALLLLALLTPWLVLRYLMLRYRSAGQPASRAYYAYMASMYYLHQLGYKRGYQSAEQYARQRIDPAMGTQLTEFVRLYQKIKYSKAPLSTGEIKLIDTHIPGFLASVRAHVPTGQRLKAFMKPWVTLSFFSKPDILQSSNNA